MTQTFLIPTDGSEHAKKAVTFGADLAQKYGANVILLHVMKELGSERIPADLRGFAHGEHIALNKRDILESVANQIMHSAEAIAREHEAPAVETQIEVGDPAAAILEVAKGRKADLIVMGSRGLGDLRGLLLGSVSHKVGHLADCTCITVK